MKVKLLAAALLFCGAQLSAQTSDQKWSIGINGGLTDYHGDLSHQWFNFDRAARANVGLHVMYNLNPWLNVGAAGHYGSIGYHLKDYNGFSADQFGMNAQIRLKFDNGAWLDEASKLKPFIYLGTGFSNLNADNTPQKLEAGTDWTINAGAGLTYMFTDLIGLNYTYNYAFTNNDNRDGLVDGGNDQYALNTLGLVFNLGKMVDTDGDGVSDKRDKCPSTPANVKVDKMGCALDSDNDGVADYKDACPEMAGTAATSGCPDKDKDGIADKDDTCPDVAGVASAMGCPDADGDGVKDSEDNCPKVKGLATMAGCPDSDGDGVIDSEDDCPQVKGTLKGCPDTDGDGIIDKDDKCPTVKGVASNNGCPEIEQATKDVFEKALKGIQFQSGRDVIKTSSYGILNNVVDIMKTHPSYKLQINGHTDSSGDDVKNMDLSKRRAQAVKAYLVKNGVEASKLSSDGFGETKPKATNDTAAGRATNRRVEFEVKF